MCISTDALLAGADGSDVGAEHSARADRQHHRDGAGARQTALRLQAEAAAVFQVRLTL